MAVGSQSGIYSGISVIFHLISHITKYLEVRNYSEISEFEFVVSKLDLVIINSICGVSK